MIVNRLRQLRERKGVTQHQVVEALQRLLGPRAFGRAMLSHYERGTSQPAGEVLDAFCAYYEVQPGDILIRQPTPAHTDRKQPASV